MKRVIDLTPLPLPVVISEGSADEDWQAWEDTVGFSDSVSFKETDFPDTEFDRVILPD